MSRQTPSPCPICFNPCCRGLVASTWRTRLLVTYNNNLDLVATPEFSPTAKPEEPKKRRRNAPRPGVPAWTVKSGLSMTPLSRRAMRCSVSVSEYSPVIVGIPSRTKGGMVPCSLEWNERATPRWRKPRSAGRATARNLGMEHSLRPLGHPHIPESITPGGNVSG